MAKSKLVLPEVYRLLTKYFQLNIITNDAKKQQKKLVFNQTTKVSNQSYVEVHNDFYNNFFEHFSNKYSVEYHEIVDYITFLLKQYIPMYVNVFQTAKMINYFDIYDESDLELKMVEHYFIPMLASFFALIELKFKVEKVQYIEAHFDEEQTVLNNFINRCKTEKYDKSFYNDMGIDPADISKIRKGKIVIPQFFLEKVRLNLLPKEDTYLFSITLFNALHSLFLDLEKYYEDKSFIQLCKKSFNAQKEKIINDILAKGPYKEGFIYTTCHPTFVATHFCLIYLDEQKNISKEDQEIINSVANTSIQEVKNNFSELFESENSSIGIEYHNTKEGIDQILNYLDKENIQIFIYLHILFSGLYFSYDHQYKKKKLLKLLSRYILEEKLSEETVQTIYNDSINPDEFVKNIFSFLFSENLKTIPIFTNLPFQI